MNIMKTYGGKTLTPPPTIELLKWNRDQFLNKFYSLFLKLKLYKFLLRLKQTVLHCLSYKMLVFFSLKYTLLDVED